MQISTDKYLLKIPQGEGVCSHVHFILPYTSLLSPADLYCPVLSCIVPGFTPVPGCWCLVPCWIIGNLCMLTHLLALNYLSYFGCRAEARNNTFAATETTITHIQPLKTCVWILPLVRSSSASDWKYIFLNFPLSWVYSYLIFGIQLAGCVPVIEN